MGRAVGKYLMEMPRKDVYKRQTDGLEWMGEIELDDIQPSDDFHYINGEEEKALSGRLFLTCLLYTSGGLIRDYIIGQVICLRKFSNLPVTKTNVTEVFSLVPARSSAGVTKVLLQWALTTVN